jgi:ribosomal protein S18 acetylase RimI-like enzyme
MVGSFVNRGVTKIDERNRPKDREIHIKWYTGSSLRNKDMRKFVEVIYRNFEYLAKYKELDHTREDILKVLTSKTSLLLVATYKGSIVSYLLADLVGYNKRLFMHIYYIFTSPSYRSNGVATFLLNNVQNYADVFNCSALSLTYDTYNLQLRKYYRSNGFRIDNELRSGGRFDMLVKLI